MRVALFHPSLFLSVLACLCWIGLSRIGTCDVRTARLLRCQGNNPSILTPLTVGSTSSRTGVEHRPSQSARNGALPGKHRVSCLAGMPGNCSWVVLVVCGLAFWLVGCLVLGGWGFSLLVSFPACLPCRYDRMHAFANSCKVPVSRVGRGLGCGRRWVLLVCGWAVGCLVEGCTLLAHAENRLRPWRGSFYSSRPAFNSIGAGSTALLH